MHGCHAIILIQSTLLNPTPVNPSTTRWSPVCDSIVNELSQHCHHLITTLLMVLDKVKLTVHLICHHLICQAGCKHLRTSLIPRLPIYHALQAKIVWYLKSESFSGIFA